MDKINPEIFRDYDIRGIYNLDFDHDFAFKLGNIIAQNSNGQDIVVGRDMRVSSDILAEKVIEGIRATGKNAISLGYCSSPLFYFTANFLNVSAGVMVTASHNDSSYNGFKIVGENGKLIPGKEVKTIFDSSKLSSNGNGQLTKENMLNEYIDAILGAIGQTKDLSEIAKKVYISPSMLMNSHIKLLEKKLGISFSKNKDSEITVAFDADGDRINFYENGKHILADYILLMLIDKIKPKNVVLDLRFSRGAIEYLEKQGIKYTKSPVGRRNIYKNMVENNSEIGGEISGHFLFSHINKIEAPEFVLIKILEEILDKGSMENILNEYTGYYKSEEINLPVKSLVFEDLKKVVEKKYSNADIDYMDGITVSCDDWWFNMRPSNTEPLIRIVVETKRKGLLKEKAIELKELVDLGEGAKD